MADVTVTHPTLPGISKKVPAGKAKAWVKAGWIRSDADPDEGSANTGANRSAGSTANRSSSRSKSTTT